MFDRILTAWPIAPNSIAINGANIIASNATNNPAELAFPDILDMRSCKAEISPIRLSAINKMIIDKLKIKIFADGADRESIIKLNENKHIKGFTTNPSLMKKAGIKDYKAFALEILPKINKPISFEIFADEPQEMQKQAEEISSWGKNIYVKIPVTNTKRISTNEIIKNLSSQGIKLNITAIFTNEQLKNVLKAINKETPTILSVFAGRIADAGYDPEEILKKSVLLCREYSKCEVL